MPKKKAAARKRSRQRTLTRRTQAVMRWCALKGSLAIALVVLGAGLWAWQRGYPEKLATTAREINTQIVMGISRTLDLRVQQIVVVGRHHITREALTAAIQTPLGTPLCAVDIEGIRTRLEAKGWIEKAHVSRRWPGTLTITLTERVPIALWQEKGSLSLIDKQGYRLENDDISAYSTLPLVVGKGAPEQAFTLVNMLAETPALLGKVASAVRVGERRWNIRFYNGMEVMLPEQDAMGAWLKFAKLAKEQDLLNRDITRFDLRQPGRAYVRLASSTLPLEKKPALSVPEAPKKAI